MRFLAGIDSGASKTFVRLSGLDNSTITEGRTEAGNLFTVDRNALETSLGGLIAGLLSRSGLSLSDCEGVCAGVAGAADPLNRDTVRDILRRIGFSCPLLVITDVKAAFAGALGCKEGIIVISGTGSVCLACDSEGNETRAGGWGRLISDEGSGYAIGRDMLHAVMWAHDENRKTSLADPAFKHFNVKSYNELIRAVYRSNTGVKDIAALAPCCIEIAEREGGEALGILEEAARSLSRLISAVYRKKWPDGAVIDWSYGGGILTGSPFILKLLNDQVKRQCPALSRCEPASDAAAGAIVILRRYLTHKAETGKWLA
jgi:N-acetylglucosamine kinase-like BadF-type ATPase